MKTKGSHVIADVWLSEYAVIPHDFIAIIDLALLSAGMTVLNKSSHVFGGLAFSANWLLAESHLSIHTFPERCYFSLDIYTCGDNAKPLICLASLLEKFDIKLADIKTMQRGSHFG